MLTRELEYELEQALEYESELEGETGAEYSTINTPSSPGDGRFQIPSQARRPSSRLFPTNTICLLEILDGKGQLRGTGTGTLIAPRVVLTAKHVLMSLARSPRCGQLDAIVGPRRAMIRVTPGADFPAATSVARRPALPQSIIAASAQIRADPNLDYGVIILPRAFTKPKEFMRLQVRGNQNTATLLTVAGYPCDKPLGTMWGHSDRLRLVDVLPNHLRYTMDTCPGHSGSPIWLLGNNNIRLLLGIHTSGISPATGASRCGNDPILGRCSRTGAPVTPVAGLNCGVRITRHVIDNIRRWCREFGVSGPIVDRY